MIVDDLKAQIEELQQKIVDIQTTCNHPEPALTNLTMQWAGNVVASRRGYIDYHCGLCDLQFRIVGSGENDSGHN